MTTSAALDAVTPLLRCPVCRGELVGEARRLVCATGHSFDVARQGYVHLGVGAGGPGTGDTAAMVEARERFLDRGHYLPIAEAVARAVRALDTEPTPAGPVLDLACGTGYYLAHVLDALPDAGAGLAVDLSAPALRRAARAHSRAAAVGADAWGVLPVTDSCVRTVLSVFGPRNAAELQRVLVPGGRVVVVAPTSRHLGELHEPMGMLGVDGTKDERQARTFADFTPAGSTDLEYPVSLSRQDAEDLVGMGPTASHVHPDELRERARALPSDVRVTVSVRVSTYLRP